MAKRTTAPRCSHVVTSRSIGGALTSLTSKIERDSVLSGRYGRSCPMKFEKAISVAKINPDRRIQISGDGL